MENNTPRSAPPRLKERFSGAITAGIILAFAIMLALPVSQCVSEGLKDSDKTADITVIDPPVLMDIPPPPEEEIDEEQIDEIEEEREPPTLEELELAMNADVSALAGGDFTVPTIDIGSQIEDMIFELKDLSVQPQPISQTEPIYPAELKRAKVDGEVVVEFVIRPDGTTERIRIRSSSNVGFEENTIRAVRKWRFKPGERDGKPVKSRVFLRIPFSVK